MGFKSGAGDLGSDLKIDGQVSSSGEVFGYSIRTSGDITASGSLVLDDGGSLKEAGGTAALTFDGSGHVTKIGQDSPSTDEVLTWEG